MGTGGGADRPGNDRRASDRRYVPTLPPGDVARLRRWHDDALRQMRRAAGTDGQTFEYLGLTLHVPPEVHPINPMSHLLGRAVVAEVRPGERVLDMGTGCGVNGILAARAGGRVLAVDVNPEAVRAAEANARRNGVGDRVQVRPSDVFDDVDAAADGPFDVIVFDPPFRWFEPRDLLEMASADAGYRALTRFVRQARRYLSARGRLLLFFGTSGDLGYLRRLIVEEGFATDVLSSATLSNHGWEVEYLTHRLVP